MCSQVYQWRAVSASKACPASHTLSSPMKNFKVTISVLVISLFFLAALFLPE